MCFLNISLLSLPGGALRGQNAYLSLGGFTLHMTGYAPACTKSVEKGSFLDIRRRRRLLQKVAANRNLGVLKWVELFRAENGIGKQHFENLCKIVKKTWYEVCLYLKYMY